MAIDGIPDRSRHGYCFYCHQWLDLTDGTRTIPEASGPLSAMRATGAAMTGDESALKFVCHRCARRRRLTRRIIFTTFFVVVAIVLLLVRLGVIQHP